MRHTEIIRKILLAAAAICALAVPVVVYLFSGEPEEAALSAAPALCLFGRAALGAARRWAGFHGGLPESMTVTHTLPRPMGKVNSNHPPGKEML